MTNKLPITEMLEKEFGEDFFFPTLDEPGEENWIACRLIKFYEAQQKKAKEEEREMIVVILDEAIKLNTLIDESTYEYIRLEDLEKVKERILSGNK